MSNKAPVERAPVEKLPLAARKNVRDEWENKKPELEEKSAQLLGIEKFTFDINPNLVYAYGDEGSYAKNSPGNCIHSYVEGFVYKLETYLNGEDEAKEAFNKVVPNATATLVPDASNTYCGCDVKDGVFRITFNPKYLGSNISDACYYMAQSIDKAVDGLGEGLPVAAQRAIKEKLVPKVEELSPKVEKMFGKAYTFEYDIPGIIAKLRSAGPKDKCWIKDEDVPGRVPELIASYFDSAFSSLEYNQFGEDEMLQEGFNEAASNAVIRFEVVDKLQHFSYCESVFVDGEFRLRTTVKNFGTNVNDIAYKVIDRL